MSESRVELRQAFWDKFTQLVARESSVLPNAFDYTDAEAPEADNWRSWQLPADARLGVNVRYDMLYLYLHLGRAETEPLFDHLQQYREDIEAEFMSQLYWRPEQNRPRGKDKIQLRRDADLIQKQDKWDDYQDWLLQNAERFYVVFNPILEEYEGIQ